MESTIRIDTYNTTEEVATKPGARSAITACILMLAVFITFTNGMIICFYMLKPNVRKHVSVFILNLVVVDFQNGILAVPLAAFRRELSASPNTYLCAFSSVWPPVLLLAVISSILLVAADRLISIIKPFQYNEIVTRPRKGIAITTVWVWSIMFGCAPLIGSRTPGGIRISVFPGEIVDAFCDEHYVYTQTYILFYLSLGILAPLIAIISIYIAMYRIAQRHIKAINAIQTASNDTEYEVKGGKVNKIVNISKAAKTAFIMSTLFVLCWVPFMIVLQLLILARISDLSKYLDSSKIEIGLGGAAFLAYLVSCVNPIIYSLRTPTLKQNLRLTFCWICHRNKVESFSGKERDLEGSMVY
ncbi:unnamed protein product [Owenia fusiformis]|uniref:Uncharacterized protein n=1 Tax=Owenia fusiformis TaxID=6347 RepID=A0A8J1TT76_OWEFU|nr:unnamed protein product [Owenia fusiformis]